MYKSFFGLRQSPFGSSPDPKLVMMMPHTREALAGLEYGIRFRKGIIVLTGEVGTGKTTLLRLAIDKLGSTHTHFSYVFNPRLEILDFLEFVLTDFGLEPATRTKAGMLQQLNRWLIECYRKQETCVILVDEAQNCTWELLEEIRLLTNLETNSEKLVQVVLSGQPELETHLRKQDARQLRQRIAVWSRVYKLSQQETVEYIQTRLEMSGAEKPIFTASAMQMVYELSGGIPRLINLLCDHALILGYVHEQPEIGPGEVRAVSTDLMMELETVTEEVEGNEKILQETHEPPVSSSIQGQQ
jgi:type II secretory pathway predicted ATPase ExeA